ncbi:MAG: hypothetical protein IJF11_02445 [Clostridia bacterium]|nr:hypothetical protein [Clostridia bacterium]
MEEKIKISLSRQTLELLKKDCEDFKIFKKDNTANMNAFINILVINFFEEFSASEEKLHDEIKKALFCVPETYKEKAFEGVINVLSKRTGEQAEKRNTTTLSFKPTRSSEKIVTYIENVFLKNETISSFYRRMLVEYSKKTKNEREKIIHNENYEALKKAISREVKVCLVLQNGDVKSGVSIYSIASSKDELFNYVLVYSNKSNHTIRLATIKSVSLMPEKSKIPEKNILLFERQIENGAQYPFYPSDDEPIKVELTEKGIKLFQKIYLYRPTPIKIEGNIYTFDCSANQALYYFERFGESALILSPKKLGIFMRNYHYYALKRYRSIYGKE